MSSPGPGARVPFPPPLVYFNFCILGAWADRMVHPFRIPFARGIALPLGIALAATGLAVDVTAGLYFKRFGQKLAPWTPKSRLVVEGPFRFSRNPMYASLAVLQLGLGIALDNGWIAASSALSLIVVHFIAVLPEEKYLEREFGEEYASYRDRVRRYF